jgi:hypothetical protein
MRKFNSAIYAKHKWLSACAETNPLLALHINHKNTGQQNNPYFLSHELKWVTPVAFFALIPIVLFVLSIRARFFSDVQLQLKKRNNICIVLPTVNTLPKK